MGSSTQRVSLKTAGSFSRTHTSLGAVKPGIAMLPVISRERGSALLERGALLLAAAVVPQDGGAQRLVAGVEQGCAVHLAGEAHGAAPPCGVDGRQRLHRGVGGAPPVGGILLGPAGLRTGNIERRGGLLHHRVFVVDDDGLDTRSADIDA